MDILNRPLFILSTVFFTIEEFQKCLGFGFDKPADPYSWRNANRFMYSIRVYSNVYVVTGSLLRCSLACFSCVYITGKF